LIRITIDVVKLGERQAISVDNNTTLKSKVLGPLSQLETAFADYGAPLAQILSMPQLGPRRRLGVVGLRLLWMLRLLCLGLIAANRLNRITINLGPLPIHSSQLLPTE
jgi:hypothetical protein